MKIKILTLGLICLFTLILTSPVSADDFTLIKSKNPKPLFSLLQFTGITLINADTVITHNSIWNSKGKIEEANPFWRGIQNRPPLVFATICLINTGIILGSSWLYKQNKFLAYLFIAVVNIVEIYCVYSNMKLWRKLR